MSSAPQDPSPATSRSSLVFVLGPGRSGTSTMTGALSHSGYTVPGAIKDPRMVWFRELRADVAQGLGVEPGFVFMLRHPSEVSSSRSSYYNVEEVAGVAGWVNVALVTEKFTAGSPRALMPYPSLTSDWRTELTRVRNALGITLDPEPGVRPHPVDDFIDPSLPRMRPGWEESEVPTYLQELGDRTFDALIGPSEAGASDATDTLDRLREDYARAHACAYSMVRARVARTRGDAAVRACTKTRKRVAARAAKASGGRPPTDPTPDSFVRRADRSVRRRLRPEARGT